MGALLRRRQMMLVGGSPTPPTPGESIPYIRGGNGSYIDTGITPDQTTKIIIWARNWNVYPGANTCLFGSDSGNATTNAFLVYTRTGANTGGISTSWGSNSIVNANDQWKHLSHYHKYEYGADGFYVDDVLVSSVTATTFSNPYSIYLFCDNRKGGQSSNATQKDICACKIYKGGVLVRDYTAVNSPSVGLYDAVSDTVFTNSGTGSFTYGSFNPNAYTPLEYISCSGSQYFDSGIYGTYSLGIVCKCRPTSGAVFHELLGYRSSKSTLSIGFGNTTTANSRVYWRFGANETVTYPLNGEGGSQTGNDIVIVKSNDSLSVYKNNAQIGTTKSTGASSSFQTADTLYIGRTHNHTNSPFIGRMYYCGLGSIRNYVPAKIDSKVGMYDTYNDVFYESMTSTPFTAGPEL